MPTRRSFLAASATGALASVAGCTDALPLVGNGSDQPSNAIESAESFLADPSFAPSIDAVREPHGTVCKVTCYDNAIANHAEDLSVEGDLSLYGMGPVRLGGESGAAIESVDYVTVADYETNWRHDDPEGELPRYGQVKGGVTVLRGEYDRDAFENARELAESPTFSANGYDMYNVAAFDLATGLADDGIMDGFLRTMHVPGEDLDDATYQEAAEVLLERAAKRSTSTASPPGSVQDVVDAVAPAHYLEAEFGVQSTDEDVAASAKGFHIDGSETTVVLAEAASSASAFETEEWTDGSIEERIVYDMLSMARDSVQDAETHSEALDAIRDMLLEGPTIDVDDSQGVARAVLPSEAVSEPRF